MKGFYNLFQSYASVNTVLGTTILSMLEPRASQSANELSLHEKFRGALRCMMSSDIKYVYVNLMLKLSYCSRSSTVIHNASSVVRNLFL